MNTTERDTGLIVLFVVLLFVLFAAFVHRHKRHVEPAPAPVVVPQPAPYRPWYPYPHHLWK